MKKNRYFFCKHWRGFRIYDKETGCPVVGEPIVKTFEEAKCRVNELNGIRNEGFEPLK